MKNKTRTLALGAMTAAALTVALPSSPAFAVDEVKCGASAAKVTYVQDGTERSRCWQNPGAVSLNQSGVTSFTAGDERVVIFWSTGLGWTVDVVEPHTSAPFTGAATYHVYGFQVV